MVRSLLVIIALSISLSIMISIPAGLLANQESTNRMAENLGSTINQTSSSINQTLSQIDVSMSSNFAGFGFRPEVTPSASMNPGQMPNGGLPDDSSSESGDVPRIPDNFGGFGGGDRPGQFGGASQASTPMNATLYSDIAEIDGVAAIEEILEASEGTNNQTTSFMGREFTTLITDFTIRGISLTSELISNYNVLPINIVEGRNLRADETGVVLLSQNNSAFFEANVGDQIEVLDETFTVIGIYEPTSIADELVLYMSLSDAQTITDNIGYITSLKIFTSNTDVVETVANEIKSLHSELRVSTQTLEQLERDQERYTEALSNAQESLASTQATATQEIIVVLAAASMIVLFVMLYTVRERTKEIGTLKAIGFSNRIVMSQFIIEGSLLSMVAGIIGIAIANFAAPTLSSLLLPSVGSSMGFSNIAASAPSVTLSPILMLEAFGGAIALGVIGSIYPAWRAAKIRPAEAMRYE